jgi:hypothetical protein
VRELDHAWGSAAARGFGHYEGFACPEKSPDGPSWVFFLCTFGGPAPRLHCFADGVVVATGRTLRPFARQELSVDSTGTGEACTVVRRG